MPFITNESFAQFVSGSRVVLVGPGAAAGEFEQGELIDSYDYVARVKSFFVPEEKRNIYGSRIDFLYTDNDQTNDVLPGDKVDSIEDKQTIYMHPDNLRRREEIIQNEIKVVISTHPQAEWFFNRFINPLVRMANLTNVRILPDEPYMEIRKETFRPNAGFSAIIDLVSLPFSEIYITGIDFYRSLYREDYLNSLWTKETILNMVNSGDGFTPEGEPDHHDPDLQFKYFKHKMYKIDSRIKVDPFLEKVLNDDRYEDFETAMKLYEQKD
jgi:hypothetical protein